jgi:hypothetical protein
MQRLRLYDVRMSRLPAAIGVCEADVPKIASVVNAVEQRLIYAKEAGDDGWWGTWAEMAFSVTRSNPYITTPRNVARLEWVNACNVPIPLNNQFFEYLQFGNGSLPKTCPGECLPPQSLMRNNVVTFVDQSVTPMLLRAYRSSASDIGKRVLAQGIDQNGTVVISQDGYNRVTGQFMQFLDTSSFVTWEMQFASLTGIQKDVTTGPVTIYQVDPATGAEILLLTMEPGETTAWYRRYYFHSLPNQCCQAPGSPESVEVKAIVKLEPIPVAVDTDYLLLQNLEAIIAEAQSMRFATIDSAQALQMSRERHQAAISFLNGELGHYLGIDSPAVGFKPFGSASLQRVRISMQ